MQTKRPVVVDIDDVLHPFYPTFQLHVEARLGFPFPYEEATKMYISELVPQLVTRELEHELVHETYADPALWCYGPMEGSLTALRALSKDHPLHLATARPASTNAQTVAYLERNYGAIFSNVTHIGLKGSDECVTTKLEHAIDLKAVAMIDDTRHHLDGCAEAGIQGILFDRTWNRGEADHPDFVRVHHWDEIPAIVQRLAS